MIASALVGKLNKKILRFIFLKPNFSVALKMHLQSQMGITTEESNFCRSSCWT